jgi:hypothetical protein
MGTCPVKHHVTRTKGVDPKEQVRRWLRKMEIRDDRYFANLGMLIADLLIRVQDAE